MRKGQNRKLCQHHQQFIDVLNRKALLECVGLKKMKRTTKEERAAFVNKKGLSFHFLSELGETQVVC